MDSYTWFIYLGVIFFIANNLLYGLSVDLFAVLLVWFGYYRTPLSTWFSRFIWIMIFLDAIYYVRVAFRRVREWASPPMEPDDHDEVDKI